MASITKSDKGYKATVSYYVGGKRRQKARRGFKTKAEANQWIYSTQNELNDPNKNTFDSNILLSDYFNDWFKLYKNNITEVTKKGYENTLINIKKYLPDMRLNEFSRQDFQQFINDFSTSHGKATVQKRKIHLTSALKDAFIEGKIIKDPTYKIINPAKSKKEKEEKFLEVSEIKTIINLTSKSLIPSHLGIYTALLSGARSGEIRALQVKDINFKDKTIDINKASDNLTGKIKETKTKSSNRNISMIPKYFEVIQEYIKTNKLKDNDYLFNLTNASLNQSLKKIIKDNNLKSVTFHALRHSHASYLLAHDIDISYISERLGHSDISITLSVYSHLLENKRIKENEKMLDSFN